MITNMRVYKIISTNDFINLINSEAHPNLKSFKLEFLKVADKFAVSIKSGYGTFTSPLIMDESALDNCADELTKQYEEAKAKGSVYVPVPIDKLGYGGM